MNINSINAINEINKKKEIDSDNLLINFFCLPLIKAKENKLPI